MLIDGYGRKVTYLRVSVTERCNFRCQYCMPEKPFSWVPHENLLSYEDMFEFIKVSIDEGITKIRLTGGEPLLRKGLDNFVRMISNYAPNIDLSITTNAYLLEETAQSLKDAGLKRLNISLDSLKSEVAHQIAQKDILEKVLRGINKAQDIGLGIKINCVPLKGINDGEIIDLLEYCKQKGYEIRFIEYMENSHSNVKQGLTSQEIQNIIKNKYKFTKGQKVGSSPSQDYFLKDGYKFGIIEPHLDDFCSNCNRLRITAEGYLIPCLYFEDALSIADAIKSKNIKEASNILRKVLQNKPEKNKWGDENKSNRAFYETGG
ncbi:Molybdenum cofactor biosynthesis protein MoaA [hydrothermal vent metagenome]|uniref:GTP 3',8-cyclase n=1 Tax=hydrothermal vent metagenome TaxID=652676 RepID=A0A3B1EA08_9ZZZZ